MAITKKQRERISYRALLAATIFVLAFGTIFYHYVEGWAWIDAYYFCVVTLTTIGYGNFVPQTDFAKIFTTIYIFVGIGILTTFIHSFLTHHGNQIAERYTAYKEKEKNQ